MVNFPLLSFAECVRFMDTLHPWPGWCTRRCGRWNDMKTNTNATAIRCTWCRTRISGFPRLVPSFYLTSLLNSFHEKPGSAAGWWGHRGAKISFVVKALQSLVSAVAAANWTNSSLSLWTLGCGKRFGKAPCTAVAAGTDIQEPIHEKYLKCMN